MSRSNPTRPAPPVTGQAAQGPGPAAGGEVLNGRYEVGPLIAGGGMAQVFHGHDRFLDRPVAIKILRPHYAASPELRDRFRREARLAASLTHAHLVNVYDVGQDGQSYFIVMELLPGETLKDLIGSRPLPLGAAVSLARQVAQGMAYAHRRGLVHRDLKPQNVLIAEDGQAKVADFGLAMRGETTQLTQPGTVWGTVQYLSPEQAQGLQAGPRSDVYALGAIFYELLTGRPPFEADTAAAVMMKHVYDVPPSARDRNPDLPFEVDALIRRAMAKDPDDRFPSMDAFAGALTDLVSGPDAPTLPWTSLPGPSDPTTVMPGRQTGQPGQTRSRPGRSPADASTVVLRPPPGQPPPPPPPSRPPDPTRGRPALSPGPGGLPPSGRSPGRPGRPPRSRFPLYVAAAVLAFFALMALGAALASQALEPGFGVVRATATPLPTSTPVPTQTPVPTPTETPAPTATPVPTVPVPALVGETQRRAEERLQQAGLAVGEVVRIFDARPAGNVVAQEPAANESLETGQPVKLTVSLGPQQVRVPNVLSKDAKGATDAITQAGLTAKAVEQFNAQIQAGVVYDQQPRGETQVNRGSTVTYYVSKGKEQIAVPVVRGKQEDEARRILEQAGLKVVVKYEAYSQADTYQVFAVVPPEGSPLDRGAEVTIRVRLDPTATPGPPAPAPTPRPGQTPARPSGQAQPSDNPRGRDRGA